MDTTIVMCCADCRVGLEAMGATFDSTPITISLGVGCDVHPDSFPVQATNPMRVTAEMLQQWRAANASAASSAPAVVDEDWREIAQLAAVLLAGTGEKGDDAIHVAIADARKLRSAAKGG